MNEKLIDILLALSNCRFVLIYLDIENVSSSSKNDKVFPCISIITKDNNIFKNWDTYQVLYWEEKTINIGKTRKQRKIDDNFNKIYITFFLIISPGTRQ